MVMAATFLGHLYAHLIASEINAQLIASVTTGLFTVFSGFCIAVPDVPNFWQFIPAIDPLRYCFDGMIQLQLYCDSCTIDNNVTQKLTCNNGQNCYEVCQTKQPGCNIIEIQPGQYELAQTYVAKMFQVTPNSYWDNVGILFGFIVAFKIITYFAALFLNFSSR